MLGNSHFNSRPHGGRRTPPAPKVAIAISTHALTEGDTFFFDCVPILPYFNSRPHGGRRSFPASWNVSGKISTHALTEGDGLDVVEEYNFEISTHALTEGDALRSS